MSEIDHFRSHVLLHLLNKGTPQEEIDEFNFSC